MDIYYILLGIVFLWLLILTIINIYIFKVFRDLIKGAGEKDLIKILKKIVSKQRKNSKNIVRLDKEIERVDKENLSNFQKIGIVRFNPFQELGGDHSFSLALLDGKENGYIITGLHTRERTRIYLKVIESGKSKLSLSSEEKLALEKALDR